MSEGNVIRVIENQPEAAAIEIPHEVGRDQSQARQTLSCVFRSDPPTSRVWSTTPSLYLNQ